MGRYALKGGFLGARLLGEFIHLISTVTCNVCVLSLLGIGTQQCWLQLLKEAGVSRGVRSICFSPAVLCSANTLWHEPCLCVNTHTMLSSVLPETVRVPLLIIYYCRLIPTLAIGARYVWGGNLSPTTLVLWLLGSHVG